MTDPMMSTEELARRLNEPGVKVVDASWHLDGRSGRAEYLQTRIPGAVFFDIDAVADRTTSLPHMLPDPAAFAAAAGALGVSERDTIVVYDTASMFAAARVWWTFRIMGARDVRVLDGGLQKWKREGRSLVHGEQTAAPVRFTPSFNTALVADFDAVLDTLLRSTRQVVDARPAARFRGEAPEPRAGLRGGHMPGARNVPASTLVAEDGTLRPDDELRAVFAAAGVDPMGPVTTTCGSGVTAAGLALALARLGNDRAAVYDGSWAEWGARSDAPIVKGGA
jgi:thiosulfate/3-mercaptopyruvate sulfurtransferase